MDTLLNALGFVLLITAFVVFRGWVMRRRRRAAQRFYQALNGPPAPAQCAQCGTPVVAGAAFCPRCGAALPPPLPMPGGAAAGGGRKAIVYVVIVILAILGLSALKAARRAPRGDTPRGLPHFDPIRR